eukprot:g24732.t1
MSINVQASTNVNDTRSRKLNCQIFCALGTEAAPGQKAGPAVVEVQRPPTSGASSGGFGSADLLSMEEHQAPQVSSAPAWDPFESGVVGAHAPAPAMIAAPWDAFGGQQAEGAWDAFQSSSTPSTGSNAQAPFNPNEGCSSRSGCMSGMHMGTGAPMSGIGCMGGCGMGTMTGGCLGGLGNIGMGGMCNQPMGQQPMGYGMGCMGCMGGAGCMQGSGCVAGPAGRGMAAGNPSMPNMPGGSLRGPAGTSGPLAPLTAPGSQAFLVKNLDSAVVLRHVLALQADDLMSKTMAGVANLSAEQRQAQGPSQLGTEFTLARYGFAFGSRELRNRGMPMGMM